MTRQFKINITNNNDEVLLIKNKDVWELPKSQQFKLGNINPRERSELILKSLNALNYTNFFTENLLFLEHPNLSMSSYCQQYDIHITCLQAQAQTKETVGKNFIWCSKIDFLTFIGNIEKSSYIFLDRYYRIH